MQDKGPGEQRNRGLDCEYNRHHSAGLWVCVFDGPQRGTYQECQPMFPACEKFMLRRALRQVEVYKAERLG